MHTAEAQTRRDSPKGARQGILGIIAETLDLHVVRTWQIGSPRDFRRTTRHKTEELWKFTETKKKRDRVERDWIKSIHRSD